MWNWYLSDFNSLKILSPLFTEKQAHRRFGRGGVDLLLIEELYVLISSLHPHSSIWACFMFLLVTRLLLQTMTLTSTSMLFSIKAYYLQFLSFFILIEIHVEFLVDMDFVCRLSIHICCLRALRIRSKLLHS